MAFSRCSTKLLENRDSICNHCCMVDSMICARYYRGWSLMDCNQWIAIFYRVFSYRIERRSYMVLACVFFSREISRSLTTMHNWVVNIGTRILTMLRICRIYKPTSTIQSFSQRSVLCFRWSTSSRGHNRTRGKKNFWETIRRRNCPSNSLFALQFAYLKSDSNKNLRYTHKISYNYCIILLIAFFED